MLRHSSTTPARVPHAQRGFTLVELMVALVVGLVVVFAAVGFVFSVAKANSENIQVTRLTQELRAMTEVMARDIRRARYVVDPVGLVGAGAAAINHDAIDAATAGCIQYSYDNPPNLPISTLSHRIRLIGNNVVLKTDAAAGAGCTSSSDGNVLNSPEIRVTGLTFTPNAANTSFDIAVTGRLANAPAGSDLAAVTRTFRETVYVRSGQVN